MKNRIQAIFFLLTIVCIILPGCSSNNEKDGVPDSIILSNEEYISFDSNYSLTNYSIQHNVDNESHTDSVALNLTGDTGYVTVVRQFIYKYQYNRSSDIWTLLEKKQLSSHKSLNFDAFINQSPWVGRCNPTRWTDDEFSYIINIIDIDTSNWTITLSYNIDFDSDKLNDIIQNAPIIVPFPNEDSFLIDISCLGNSKLGDAFEITFHESGLRVNGIE